MIDQIFQPGPDQERAYRDALGQFATGVTVITAAGPDGPVGFTANSFSSVSLDPALVLWCPAKNAQRFDLFATAPHFAIHVLREDQADLSQHFAINGDDFSSVDWQADANGVPLFDACAARFSCRLEATHDAGDHVIVVGRVGEVYLTPSKPLIFAKGGYGRFIPQD